MQGTSEAKFLEKSCHVKKVYVEVVKLRKSWNIYNVAELIDMFTVVKFTLKVLSKLTSPQ